MGQCKLASKVGGGKSKDTKNYIFKDGILSIQPSAKASVTVGTSGIVVAANGYMTIPYAKTGETVFVRFKVNGDGSYNSFSTTKALTASYNGSTSSGTMMPAYMQLNQVYVWGGATNSVISLCCSQPITITDIWTEVI